MRVGSTLPSENQPFHANFHPFPAIFRCKIAKNGNFAPSNHVKTKTEINNSIDKQIKIVY